MAFDTYLAMTAAEIAMCDRLPPKTAWMGCHFSPYGTGISNLPAGIPEGSMIILNDRIPLYGHDPKRIADELADVLDKAKASALLLDLQRSYSDEMRRIVECVLSKCNCPAAVTEAYAPDTSCAVFLPLPDTPIPLETYIRSYKNRRIWLEATTQSCVCRVTSHGSEFIYPQDPPDETMPFYDEKTCWFYKISVSDDSAVFTLCRTTESIEALLAQAKELNIELAVGLYQQLGC